MKETTKRKLPFGPSGLGMHHILPQKRRVVEKDVGQLQIHSENPLNLGKGDYLHSSSRNRRTRFIKVDIGGRGDSFHLRTSTTLDAESHTSSVSSCNANSGDLACSFINHCRTYDADEASDAESICGKEYKEKTNPQNRKDKSLSRAHSLELRTYSHVVKALFASGPLSWEEETNMSNLRQSLHISDDEHLALVRSLVSSGTRVLIC